MPALTADLFGSRYLGANYGFVFLGWGLAFCGPLGAGVIRDRTGTLELAFYGSAVLLIVGAIGSLRLRPPLRDADRTA
jgi:OFA family oxalate/formate antiporter-like MFS transporter